MSEWNFLDFASKDTLPAVMNREAGEPRGPAVMLVRAEGVTVEPGPVDDLPVVLGFDPASDPGRRGPR